MLAGQFLAQSYGADLGELTGPRVEAEVSRRSGGFREALDRVLNAAWTGEGDWSEESGEAWGHQILAKPSRPRAVFCHGDRMALGLMRAAARQGLRVPDDLAVLGFDNLLPGAWSAPPLTTIDPHLTDAGDALARTLVTYLETGEVVHRVLEPHLVVRASA